MLGILWVSQGCRVLLRQGHEVLILDSSSPPTVDRVPTITSHKLAVTSVGHLVGCCKILRICYWHRVLCSIQALASSKTSNFAIINREIKALWLKTACLKRRCDAEENRDAVTWSSFRAANLPLTWRPSLTTDPYPTTTDSCTCTCELTTLTMTTGPWKNRLSQVKTTN